MGPTALPIVKTVAGNGPGVSMPVVLTPADLSVLGNGLVTVAARQADNAGNVQTVADAQVSFTLDTQQPTAPVLTPGSGVANGATLAEATQPSGVVRVYGEENANIRVVFSGNNVTLAPKTLTGNGATQPVALTEAEVAALGDGLITATATQIDEAGNSQAGAASSYTFLLDTVGPQLSIFRAGSGTLRSSATETIFFALNEDSVDFTRAAIAVTGGSLGDLVGSGRNYSAQFTPNANSDTTGTVTVLAGRFTDTVGNANAANAVLSLPIDTKGPTVVGITATPQAGKTVLDAGDTVTLVATVTEAVPAGSRIAVRLSSQGLGKAPVILTAMMDGTVLVGTHVVELGEISAAPFAEVVTNGTSTTDLIGNPIVVTGARFTFDNFTVDAMFKFADATWGPASPDGYDTILIDFNADVIGVTIDAVTLNYRGRSVSLRDATLSGSGSRYVLRLPERILSLDGGYQIYFYSQEIRMASDPDQGMDEPIFIDLPDPGTSRR